jgi:hypothetical protein
MIENLRFSSSFHLLSFITLFISSLYLLMSLSLEPYVKPADASADNYDLEQDLSRSELNFSPARNVTYLTERDAARTWCEKCGHWRLCRTHHCSRCGVRDHALMHITHKAQRRCAYLGWTITAYGLANVWDATTQSASFSTCWSRRCWRCTGLGYLLW